MRLAERNGKVDAAELLRLFKSLDRALFIDNAFKECAALNRPLPIGHGQTISQPSLVLEMTALLLPDKSCRVLEIGTGSGYQTALLAMCVGEVYTVERIPELSEKARARLEELGLKNVRYRVGDGSEGWKAHAPYDRIITTAAAQTLPEMLISQLKPGGIAIAPVGPKGIQDLLRITKDKAGGVRSEPLGKVTFVELKGRYGWTED
jgi:protein-L-isoaspartate(D-aspartate) O-methyltransferase